MLVAGPISEQTLSLLKAELWTDQHRGWGPIQKNVESSPEYFFLLLLLL